MEKILNNYERALEKKNAMKGYILGDLKNNLTESEKNVLVELYNLTGKNCIVDISSLQKIHSAQKADYQKAAQKYYDIKNKMEKELNNYPPTKSIDFKSLLIRKMIMDKYKPTLKNASEKANYHKENMHILNASVSIFEKIEKILKERSTQKLLDMSNASINSAKSLAI